MDIKVELEPNLNDYSHLIGKTVMLYEYSPIGQRFTGVSMLGQLVAVSAVVKPNRAWTFHFNGNLEFTAAEGSSLAISEYKPPFTDF